MVGNKFILIFNNELIISWNIYLFFYNSYFIYFFIFLNLEILYYIVLKFDIIIKKNRINKYIIYICFIY